MSEGKHAKFLSLIEKKVKFKINNEDILNNELNLFKIISNQYKRENFHSDIISALLRHKEDLHGKIILNTFINIINENLNSATEKIDFQDFYESKICREAKRIDIVIFGKSKNDIDWKSAIIIENKINKAPDQPRQIPRYYDELTLKEKKDVKAIVYIPLKGDNLPYQEDWSEEDKKEINPLLVVLPAFRKTGEKKSLISWLKNVQPKIKNLDCFLIIRQYIELLTQLGKITMDLDEMKKLMNFISEKDRNETAKGFMDAYNQLPEYQAQEIEKLYSNELKNYYTKLSEVWLNKSQGRWIFKCEDSEKSFPNIPEVLRFSFDHEKAIVHLWGNPKGNKESSIVDSFINNNNLDFQKNPKDKVWEYIREFSFPDRWKDLKTFVKEELIPALQKEKNKIL
ncbi:MAG: hypothetical protein AB8G86_22420 [Saprospiraceae bacterium]